MNSGPDRRVQKTRALLHGALTSLVHEKPYDDIVVKEILGRANVGRSTFYDHYRDKDELLERGIRKMLHLDAPSRAACLHGRTDELLRFSLPFLEHIERSRDEGELPLDSGGSATVHEHLRRVLESLLVDELRGARGSSDVVPPHLLARHIAAAFVLNLEWWLEHPTLSAREVDAGFRAFVVPTLTHTLGS
ncbi:MAG TPA: TetR/AcrR family transcriptional regulator [Gemmatimonadaceae bacterium]|nr:TetR/AcrR family transcriptional regulator [Gemmatimonadaceae bacterium]